MTVGRERERERRERKRNNAKQQEKENIHTAGGGDGGRCGGGRGSFGSGGRGIGHPEYVNVWRGGAQIKKSFQKMKKREREGRGDGGRVLSAPPPSPSVLKVFGPAATERRIFKKKSLHTRTQQRGDKTRPDVGRRVHILETSTSIWAASSVGWGEGGSGVQGAGLFQFSSRHSWRCLGGRGCA